MCKFVQCAFANRIPVAFTICLIDFSIPFGASNQIAHSVLNISGVLLMEKIENKWKIKYYE